MHSQFPLFPMKGKTKIHDGKFMRATRDPSTSLTCKWAFSLRPVSYTYFFRHVNLSSRVFVSNYFCVTLSLLNRERQFTIRELLYDTLSIKYHKVKKENYIFLYCLVSAIWQWQNFAMNGPISEPYRGIFY